MKDELKEILDICTPFLFGDEVDKLTNYITNLQEENIKLKSRNKSLNAENSYYKNIINELEKWAKEELEQPNWASCGARCMLDKLKELKEGK